MKNVGNLMLLAVMAILVMGFAYAAEPGGATVTGNGDLGEFNAPAAGTASVEAGNVTTADLDTNQSTIRWVGLLGDVSGNIVLGDATNTTLYTWVAEGNLVYASTGTVDWASLAITDNATVVSRNAWLGGDSSDNYSNTFNGTTASLGSNIFTLSPEVTHTSSNGGNAWATYSLDDGTSAVWAGAVDVANENYNGTVVDYQMIIPEDGTAGNTVATAYNLWVELV